MNTKSFSPSILILFITLSLSLSLPSHATTDTLTKNQTISDGDGQTLISSNSVFEFGFFSPNNTTNRYVGVWYHNIIPQTVVWVANRTNPIPTPTGILSIHTDGNLVLQNSVTNLTIWFTNITTTYTDAFLIVSDDGNLVLNSTKSGQLWQSFDFPTDTFLPGMTVSNFTSWTSDKDPSPGNYTVGVDPFGSQQFFMWEGSVIRWRSGLWDRTSFTGLPGMASNLYGFYVVPATNDKPSYFTYTVYNTSSLLRFTMDSDGVERTSKYDKQGKAWDVVWSNPQSNCDYYDVCGANGLCSDNKGDVKCECVEGFVPRDGEEWGRGDWKGGCVRRAALDCGVNGTSDRFFAVANAKLPDFSDFLNINNENGCYDACIKNCSCLAYAFVEGIGCLNWGRDLVDVRRFNGSGEGNNVFLRLAASEFVNQTIVSPAGNFALGFFNISGDLYVSIWYNNIPNKTIIWVANRDTPLKDPAGVFSITKAGNLAVLDNKGNTYWSSNTSLVVGNKTSAMLSDTGNLVLGEDGTDNNPAWQSFDNPTDTVVPGMQLGLDSSHSDKVLHTFLNIP
ncbi:putative G-type lectin S-receptor-like serine/threonine-protein kinase [Acorus calamus]|uniref:non-specific serine/threonine protein kinase n=1 Tax=Acorus calamus TaxID=4465 RepID=A0AAV9DTT7_ACOCL|nr:putative G-type lectin S-receptor-like serine/threonine-protein kinase [Acorus calamus]